MNKGEFAAVVGESGSGKSTLLNCIGGLETPTSGKIYINNDDIFKMKEQKRTIFRRRNIGFVFQSFQLIPELNVEQNIIFPLLLDYKKPDKKDVDEILTCLGFRTDVSICQPIIRRSTAKSRNRASHDNKTHVDFG